MRFTPEMCFVWKILLCYNLLSGTRTAIHAMSVNLATSCKLGNWPLDGAPQILLQKLTPHCTIGCILGPNSFKFLKY